MADRLFEEVSRVLSVTGGTEETIILSRVPDYIIVDVIGGAGFDPIWNERILQGGQLQLGDPTGTGLFLGAISFDGNVVGCGYYSSGEYNPTLTVKAYIGQVMVDDITLSNIADAIRAKTGTNKKYLPSEMADAIYSIGDGGAV